ncbi:PPR: pentatricopeptide repeat domain containing protein [Nitzschia inconspicua]|uniref:PPR: pentatricopeptide repeat domain containing protein n=1 Tax=Nitzschia inconspicua TaxID=303405 RepID=A0A9K3LSJ9_9STRA|nr:PPR: pentatricopeptide repeat domain containing protein [Nitzschia inconspicua]
MSVTEEDWDDEDDTDGDDLEIQYLDGDDDGDDDGDFMEFSPAEAKSKVDDWMREMQQLARSSSRDEQAVDKAQDILNEMFELYVQSEDSTFFPTTQVYNYILEAYAYSKDPKGADEAMALLEKMHDLDNVYIARPNVESYLNVMDAFAMRDNPEKVQQLISQQEQYATSSNSDDLTVTAEAYNKLIKAYGIAGQIEQAEATFRSLVTDNTANQKSWVQIMKAYQSHDDLVSVESLLEEMIATYESTGNKEFQPQIEAYNVWIRSMGMANRPDKAEAKLYELMNRYRQGDRTCQPNADTFRNVIFAYNQDRKQQHSAATVSKLDQLLQIQESFLNLRNPETPWSPDEQLYNAVIGMVARSKDPQKATRIQKIMDRFQKSTQPSDSILRRMYFSQLSACAHVTKDATPEDKLAAFQIASQIWNMLKSDTSPGLSMDSSMAGMFLIACRTLLPKSEKRDKLVHTVFDECCQRGIVNDFVLNELDGVTDEATQLQWFGGFIEDGVRMKKEWRRNVVEKR